MVILLLILCFILFLLTTIFLFKINKLKNIKYNQPEILSDKKILIAYYSNIGNTRNVAQNLYSIINEDIEEIQLKEKYPKNIFKMSKIIRKQIKENFLPEINNIDVKNYDVIFIGSPIWNSSLSLPLKSFLKNNNFEDKILIPFFTYSGGANTKKIYKEIKELANAQSIQKPTFFFENGIFLVKERLIAWLNKL